MSKSKYRSALSLDFLSGVLNRNLKLIFVSTLIGAFGDGLYYWMLPLYVRALGAGPVEVGIVFSIQCLTAAFTLILGGLLADKYDRKKVIILGWLVWLPVPVIFSLATNWIQLLPGAVLYGCWIGQPAFSAYVATSADKQKMMLTFAVISSSWSFGYFFSPALGGYVSTVIGMRWVFYLAFLFYASCTCGLFFISSQQVRTQFSELSLPTAQVKEKKIIVWSIFFAVIMFFMFLIRPLVPQILDDEYKLSEFHIGVLGSITFLGSAPLGIILGRIGDRWKKAGAISVCMVLSCVSIVTLFLFNNFFTLSLACFLLGASFTTWSLIGAVVGSFAPETLRARWISFPLSASMLAAFSAPYLGGLLYEAWPYNPFLVFIMATLVLSVLALARIFEE
ncbi:MAG: MFS transporter [Candidatus Bathyarchaeia archaeon]